MKRWLVGATVAAAVVVLPTTAWAKGATRATITGPGLVAPVVVDGQGEPGSGTALGTLAEETGLFSAMFETQPDPMLSARPAGALGVRYAVRYLVPGGDAGAAVVAQSIYPYAEAGILTFTAPGQPIFQGQTTRGGWFLAPAKLRSSLAALHVAIGPAPRASLAATPQPPARAATGHGGATARSSGPARPDAAAAGLGLLATLILGAVVLRRRSGAATLRRAAGSSGRSA